MKNVYLDNAATTPLHPDVLEAMFRFSREHYGNPSSPHLTGQKARALIEDARDKLAHQLNCKPGELVFTSGGTESNNLALLGIAYARSDYGNHIVTSATEHTSVLETMRFLERSGYRITRLYPDRDGVIGRDAISNAITQNTILVSVMDTNNETGIRNPVQDIAEICCERHMPYHCDIIQSFGKFPVDLQTFPADLVSLSGHKIHGPKGIGALYIREGNRLDSIHFGGSQERNRRPGTENTIGIAGFAEAITLIKNNIAELKKITALQSYFEDHIKEIAPFAEIIGEKVERSPYISNIAFKKYDNMTLMMRLDMAGISVSAGSACSSGSINRSPVLKAMHVPDDVIGSSVRFGFSSQTTYDEIDYALDVMNDLFREK